MLDRDDAATAHAKAKAERSAALRRMHELDKTVRGLDRIIDGYEMLFPELRPVRDGEAQGRLVETQPRPRPRATRLRSLGPKGQEAVLEVLRDPHFARRKWTSQNMTAELEKRGWAPSSDNPENAVRVTLSRIAQSVDGVVKVRAEDGIAYLYRPQTDSKIAEPTIRVDSGASKGGS